MTSSNGCNFNQKVATSKSPINCSDFSQSEIPNLKEMDHYMFVEYTGQGHLHPQRVASARSRNVASIKLTYYSPDHITFLKDSSNNLNLLDLTGSNLFKLPSELISGMNNLQIIILDNNQLSDNSFCKEFSTLLGKSLKEIDMCNNRLTSLLPNAESFVKLLRLKVCKNALSNLKGIEKLKRLKLLIADSNEISQLGSGFYMTKRLEHVYMSHNKITSLSPAIRSLVHLRELDLSNNCLKTIPGDIFLLPKIQILKLNNNKLGKIPKFKISSRLNCPITFVDLSFNNISRFPDCVMRITEELDLSNNKIKTVPSSILKKIPYQSCQKVYLANNPVSDPPKEICESGLKAMVQYYEEFEGTEAKYYGIKIFCFGDNINQKNRFVNILNDQADDDEQQAENVELVEIFDSNSKVIDTRHRETPSFNVRILSLSVDRSYFDILFFFLTFPSLNLILIDIDKWSDESFYESIEFWLRSLLFTRTSVVFSVVCLTRDKSDETVKEKCDQIKGKVSGMFAKYIESIESEIRKIESKTKITASMSQTLKKFIQLRAIKYNSNNNVLDINTDNPKSIKRFQGQLMNLINDKNIFPNVGDPVPSFWSDVQTYIEDECYQFPIMHFDEFESLLQYKFNLKPVIKQVAKYLHDVGCIQWSEEAMKPANQWIITSPQVLIESCRLLFQHDLKAFLEDPNDPNTNAKRFKKRFPSSRFGYRHSCEILLNDAILLPELTVVLLENIVPTQYTAKMLFYLCQCWNLGYIVDFQGIYCQDWAVISSEFKDNLSDVTSSVASQEFRGKSVESRQSLDFHRSNDTKSSQIPPVFLTLLCKRTKWSTSALDQWQVDKGLRITIYYRFPMGYSNIIFHQATVRAKDQAGIHVTLTDHWIDGFQGQIKDEPIFLRIQRSVTENEDSVIQYDFLYRDNDQDTNDAFKASEIWKWVHGILIDMDSLLNSYQGLWFERFVKCPCCNDLSFPGTWHSYNDNDLSQSEPCTKCDNIVPIYLLEPPKISKNVSAEEIIRNIRKQFDRQ